MDKVRLLKVDMEEHFTCQCAACKKSFVLIDPAKGMEKCWCPYCGHAHDTMYTVDVPAGLSGWWKLGKNESAPGDKDA